MGIVWEAYHKRVPSLGVPGITLEHVVDRNISAARVVIGAKTQPFPIWFGLVHPKKTLDLCAAKILEGVTCISKFSNSVGHTKFRWLIRKSDFADTYLAQWCARIGHWSWRFRTKTNGSGDSLGGDNRWVLVEELVNSKLMNWKKSVSSN